MRKEEFLRIREKASLGLEYDEKFATDFQKLLMQNQINQNNQINHSSDNLNGN